MSIPKIVIGRDMPVFKPCQTMLNKIMNAGGFLIQIPSSPQGPVNCLKVFFTRVARIKIVNQKNCCLNSSKISAIIQATSPTPKIFLYVFFGCENNQYSKHN